MVDVFTVLLVFLLKSYSAEGTLITPVPVNLPSSTANNYNEMNLNLTVTEKELYLDNFKILDPSFLSTDRQDIPKLNDALGALIQKKDFPSIQKKVTIMGDKKIPYFLLKKVIYTLTQNGFSDISLAVYQKAGES